MVKNNTRMTFVFRLKDFAQQEALKIHKTLVDTFGEKYKSEYSSYTPHITVYQAEFPDKNENDVLMTVKEVVKMFPTIMFTPTGISTKRGYVAVTFQKTPTIKSFQEILVKKLNPMREGVLKDVYNKPSSNLEKNEQENIQLWGYPYLFDAYNPHLTLISLEKQEDVSSAQKMIFWDHVFEVDQVEVVISKDGNFVRAVEFCMK